MASALVPAAPAALAGSAPGASCFEDLRRAQSDPQGLTLRFPLGTRVLCLFQYRSQECPCWRSGTVVQHWLREDATPEGLVAAYQVMLDYDDKLICVGRDSSRCILGAEVITPELQELKRQLHLHFELCGSHTRERRQSSRTQAKGDFSF